MEKNEIIEKLDLVFADLVSVCESVSPTDLFKKSADDKWSIAENIHHLSLTYMPVNASARSFKAMEEKWGSSGRKSRTYDQLLEAYADATSAYAWKTFPPFVPKRADQKDEYVRLHAADSKTKLAEFYAMVGEEIQSLTDRVPLDEMQPGSLLKMFKMQSRLLVQSAARLTEEQLDSLQIPIPYLGLITFREILYFTHFHTKHHLNSVKAMCQGARTT